jgi:hypothetical protein
VARENLTKGWDCPRSLILIQAQSTGNARATRQKALVKGPTSATRTKIGDTPITSAPTTSAEKGAAMLAGRGAADGEGFIEIPACDAKGLLDVLRFGPASWRDPEAASEKPMHAL